MRSSTTLALAASVSSALASYKGFNYGSTNTAGTPYTESDFTNLFNNAAGLTGTSGFTSARLYTMIQGGTTDTVISAIPAALNTKTQLLLGLWGSGGAAGFANELTALKNAISQYPGLASQIAGISVGSEDLYRISPSAAQAGSTNPGAEPSTLVDYISQVRSVLAGSAWSGAKVGHVDTWTAYANTSNDVVASACDFVGVDAYPYFQTVDANTIDNGASLFKKALDSLTATAKSKDVWVTETGWPVSGPTENQAVPSVANAEQYWQQVGCDFLFNSYNTWWYTFDDAGSSPSFGVSTGSTTPLYNLSCGTSSSSSSSSAVASSTSAISSAAAPTVPNTVAASGGSSIPNPTPGVALGTQSGSAAQGSAGASATGGASTSSKASAASSSAAAASIPTGEGWVYETVYETHYETVCGCASSSSQTLATSATSSSAAKSSTTAAPSASASSSAAKSSSASTTTSATPKSSACPADINGDYQYPHLIVPVSSGSPNTAYGTQYNATINGTTSTIFNFDIPQSYSGKTCSLVFLFPLQSQLETSAYTFNNQGGLDSHVLASTASASTTYANAPAQALENGSISSLKSGNSYVISSDKCPAGTSVSFELSATGGLALEFFEDYNPSPLGLYVRAC